MSKRKSGNNVRTNKTASGSGQAPPRPGPANVRPKVPLGHGTSPQVPTLKLALGAQSSSSNSNHTGPGPATAQAVVDLQSDTPPDDEIHDAPATPRDVTNHNASDAPKALPQIDLGVVKKME